MLPRLLALTLLGVLALALSGCVSMTMESTFNEDGSARHSLRTTIEKDALEQLEEFTSDFSEGFEDTDATPEPGADDESDDPADTFDLSDEEVQALEDAGFSVEEIDTDEEVGVVISRDFPEGTSLTDAFNELMRANSEDDSDIPLGAIDGFFNRDGDTWTLDLNIDSDRLLESTEEATGTEPEEEAAAEATIDTTIPGMDFESMGIDFDIEYIANFPGTITETNGDIDDDNDSRVTWELPMTGNTTLNALVNANSGGAGGDGRLPWIIGGIVAVALIGVLAAFMISRNRNQPAVATVGAAPAAPPMAGGPMTGAGLPPTNAPQPPTHDTATTVSDTPAPGAWAPPTTTGPWNPPPSNPGS